MPHRFQVSAVLVSLLVIGQAGASLAEDSPAVQTVVNAVIARTGSVRGYTADLSLHVKLHSFPFIGMTFRGSTIYSRPGKYAVTLHTLPEIAKAFAKISGDVGDPTGWQKRYDVSIVDASLAPPGQLALRLTPKESCQVAYALVFVDTSTESVQRTEWHYVSGGRIDVDEHYAIQNGVLLSSGQTAEITMPGIHATASSTLSNIVVQTDVAAVTTADKP